MPDVTPSDQELDLALRTLWKAFDGTPIPGPWVGRSDAFVIPAIDHIESREFTDLMGLKAKADLHGFAEVDGERYAWLGVIHRGDGPASESDVNRLFDAATSELAGGLSELNAVVLWLMSPTGITTPARARLAEFGALFSGRSDLRNLLEAFDVAHPLGPAE